MVYATPIAGIFPKIKDSNIKGMRCPVCQEMYEAERIPRILDCGHCMCTECVEYTIQFQKECPLCHSISVGDCASAFRIDNSISETVGAEKSSHKTTTMKVKSPNSKQKHDRSLPDKMIPVASEFIKEKRSSLDEGRKAISFSAHQRSRTCSEGEEMRDSLEQQIAMFLKERTQGMLHKDMHVSGSPEEINVFSTSEDMSPSNFVIEQRDYTEQGNSTNILETSSETRTKISFKKQSVRYKTGRVHRHFPDNNISVKSKKDKAAITSPKQWKNISSTKNHMLQGHTSTHVAHESLQNAMEIVGLCQDHDLPFSFMCLTCNVWGCQSCSDASTYMHHSSNDCLTLQPQEAMQALKIMYKDNAGMFVKTARRIKKKVQKEMSGVTVIENYYEKQFAKVRSELEKVEHNLLKVKMFKDEAINTNTEINTLINKLIHAYKEADESNTTESIISAIDNIKSSQKLLKQYSMFDMKRVPAIQDIQIHKKKEVLKLLEAGVPVYGMLLIHDRQTWSQLSLDDGQILLHCLREDVYPNEGVPLLSLPYESLRQMVPENSAILFMDIGWAGERRGRVYVSMTGNTARSRQALLLSSGERGPSYRNTIFYKRKENSYWNSKYRQEILYGGDYEYNDGSGGRAIVADITNGGEHTCNTLDGMMVSWPAHEHWRLGCFNFYVYGNPSKTTDTAFGRVTHGLEILRAAAKQIPVSNSYICDCGLVIPYDVD